MRCGRVIHNRTAKRPIVGYVVYGMLYTLGVVIWCVVNWSVSVYRVDIPQLMYTLVTPMAGTDSGVVDSVLSGCVPHIVIGLIPLVTYIIWDAVSRRDTIWCLRMFTRERCVCVRTWLHKAAATVSVAVLLTAIAYGDAQYAASTYLVNQMRESTLYDTQYVNPADVTITAGDTRKNLICIYLESMETTYADVQSGGKQETNLISNLTALAQTHTSFSHTDALGGFRSMNGTTWTMGALFAMNAGLPYQFPLSGGAWDDKGNYASNVTTLGDILHANGYTQRFLCGSDAEYANRADLFVQHGEYTISDVYTARENGYIAEDYFAWWGYEDTVLYDIAKQEITALAQADAPFNYTMLTADTHFPDGYICDVCENTGGSTAETVIACADRQIGAFLAWCQEQDFYEDTVIVVVGDHPRMDTALEQGNDRFDNTIYNCILNAVPSVSAERTTHREFTAMDMFPTVLSALGFTIEGDRLGLGTDLFSDTATLAEQLGPIQLHKELSKHADVFADAFR